MTRRGLQLDHAVYATYPVEISLARGKNVDRE